VRRWPRSGPYPCGLAMGDSKEPLNGSHTAVTNTSYTEKTTSGKTPTNALQAETAKGGVRRYPSDQKRANIWTLQLVLCGGRGLKDLLQGARLLHSRRHLQKRGGDKGDKNFFKRERFEFRIKTLSRPEGGQKPTKVFKIGGPRLSEESILTACRTATNQNAVQCTLGEGVGAASTR